MNSNGKFQEPVREGAFLFEFGTIARIDQEEFNRYIQPIINTMLVGLHENVFDHHDINYRDEKVHDSIIKFVQDGILQNINMLPENRCPYRFMINDCIFIETINGGGFLYFADDMAKLKINETNIITTLFESLKNLKNGQELYERAKKHSQFLLFDIVVFTKYAPLTVINGNTGEEWIF